MNRLAPPIAELEDSFLLDCFWEFYREVVRLKRLAQSTALDVDPAAAPAAPGGTDLRTGPQSLQALLERQEGDARRRGGDLAVGLLREAQYAMTALADETFLFIVDWSGREAWAANLLEYRLFRTHVAGERVFTGIDRLLQRKDAGLAELAVIYLMVLRFGFRGRYRDVDDHGAIAERIEALYTFAIQDSPSLDTPGRRLGHGAPPEPLRNPAPPPLSSTRRWMRVVIVIAVLVLLGLELTFELTTADIELAAERVAATAGTYGN